MLCTARCDGQWLIGHRDRQLRAEGTLAVRGLRGPALKSSLSPQKLWEAGSAVMRGCGAWFLQEDVPGLSEYFCRLAGK